MATATTAATAVSCHRFSSLNHLHQELMNHQVFDDVGMACCKAYCIRDYHGLYHSLCHLLDLFDTEHLVF